MRARLTFANVVSVLALFVALGGTGYAATKINGSDLKNRSVAAKKLKRHTLTSTQIKANSLGASAIRESTLSTVPRARSADNAANAATLGGHTAASLKVSCPAGMTAAVGLCFEPAPPPTGGCRRSARCSASPPSSRRRSRRRS
jgi:hypothetical protein